MVRKARAVAMTMLATVLMLGGCGGTGSSAGRAGVDGADDTVRLVVIGDSLINPGVVCPGCTGFVERYGEELGAQLGRPSEYVAVPAFTVPDAIQAIAEDLPTRDEIAAADVVVVEVGYNNALPDPQTGIGCQGSLSDGFVRWMRSTRPICLAEGVATYGALYDQIFASLEELRGARPTVFVLANSINGNIDPDRPGLLFDTPARDREFATRWALAAYERWNAMLLDRATAAGFTYVDLWHAFNGPDGTQPFGDLSIDGAHPSQRGNDVIAGKLGEVDTSALRRS
ncbi:MAG: GDSL-type esterase/lipase family protein [Nocardioides sp.]